MACSCGAVIDRCYLIRGVRIEYDVGAVRYLALLPLSTTSRIVIYTALRLAVHAVTEETDTRMARRRGVLSISVPSTWPLSRLCSARGSVKSLVATPSAGEAPLAWLRASRDVRLDPEVEVRALRTDGYVSATSWREQRRI